MSATDITRLEDILKLDFDYFQDLNEDQRIQLLSIVLPPSSYSFNFIVVRKEPLYPTVTRLYYAVLIENIKSRQFETFEFFCPFHHKKTEHRQSENNLIDDRPAWKKHTKVRLLSFLQCIVSDYSTIEHEGIRDGFDLMSEFGYEDPQQARDIFNALSLNHNKIKKVFPPLDWQAIEKIVEGY